MWKYSESSNSHVTWVLEEEEKEDKPEKYSEKKGWTFPEFGKDITLQIQEAA